VNFYFWSSKKIFNHFQYIDGIATKNGLHRSLERYYASFSDACTYFYCIKRNWFIERWGYTIFHSCPVTYICRAGEDSYSRKQFFDVYRRGYSGIVAKYIPKKHAKDQFWLVKPSALNRGRGIGIFNTLNGIK
jgi:hypothetical protein